MRLFYLSTHYATTFGVALLSSLLLSGCSRQPGLVGKWSGSGPAATGVGGGVAAYTYSFHNDGLVEVSAKIDKAPSSSSPSLASIFLGDGTDIHTAGSYSVKDDVLTIKQKSVTLLDDKGQPPPLITPTVKQEPQIIRYKISGTTLTLDMMDGDKPLVLTRQKDSE